MNFPQQSGVRASGGIQPAFPGTVSGPINMSGGLPIPPGYQSGLRQPPHVTFSSNIQTFPNGSLPSNSVPNASLENSQTVIKQMQSIVVGGGLDQPPDEGIIHNIKEIRMPPKPKNFRLG